jgi:hypothetical protein
MSGRELATDGHYLGTLCPYLGAVPTIITEALSKHNKKKKNKAFVREQ